MGLIYNYNPETGEYLGPAAANVSPREPGVLLVPAFAVPVAPPAVGDRQCVCYLDAAGLVPADYQSGVWQIVPDWRGVPLWDKASGDVVAITLPNVLPADIGATAEVRPSAVHVWRDGEWVADAALQRQQLADLVESQVSAVNAERDRREEAGFPYRGKLLDSTPRSVQRITAAALAAQASLAAGQTYSVEWICADNSPLPLDAAGVIGMPVALALHAAALHDHARALKAAVAAAASEADLVAIDIQVGWPGVAP